MSLDFEYEKVDAEKYPPTEDGYINMITNACVWMTMNVGMGQPSKDPDEWVFRVLFWEQALSPHLREWDEERQLFDVRPLTAEEVRDHADIHTNVTQISRTAFMKKVVGFFEQDLKISERRAEKIRSES